MNTPVIWGEHTFDLSNLQTWVQTCKNKDWAVTQPITRAALPAGTARVEDLPQNRALRDMIKQFVKKKIEKANAKQKPAATPAAAMEHSPIHQEVAVARPISAQIFEQHKDTFVRTYWTAGFLVNFRSKWNSYSGGEALPDFGTGEQGANTWFAYFLRNPAQRAIMLRLIVRFDELRPNQISAQSLLNLASQTESEKGNAAVAAVPVQNQPQAKQPSTQLFEQYKDLFVRHYWTAEKLSNFGGKWDSYGGGSALPYFGDTHEAANEALNYFKGRRTTLSYLFALLAHFDHLRPELLSKEVATRMANPEVLSRLVKRYAMTD